MRTALDLQTEFSYRLFLLLKNAILYCEKYIALAGAFCGFSPTSGKSFFVLCGFRTYEGNSAFGQLAVEVMRDGVTILL